MNDDRKAKLTELEANTSRNEDEEVYYTALKALADAENAEPKDQEAVDKATAKVEELEEDKEDDKAS